MIPPFFSRCSPTIFFFFNIDFFSLYDIYTINTIKQQHRNYCLIVFIVYMSYSDTQKLAKCCLHEKKSMLKKRGGKHLEKKGGMIGSCSHVPVYKGSCSCLSSYDICSRNDIADILLRLALNTNQSVNNEVPVTSRKNERSSIGIYFVSVSTISLLNW